MKENRYPIYATALLTLIVWASIVFVFGFINGCADQATDVLEDLNANS